MTQSQILAACQTPTARGFAPDIVIDMVVISSKRVEITATPMFSESYTVHLQAFAPGPPMCRTSLLGVYLMGTAPLRRRRADDDVDNLEKKLIADQSPILCT